MRILWEDVNARVAVRWDRVSLGIPWCARGKHRPPVGDAIGQEVFQDVAAAGRVPLRQVR